MATHKRKHRQLVIGWREMVSLPEWGVNGLLAKSDTGAASSALDVRKIEELPEGRIRFEIVVERARHVRTRTVEATIVGRTRVRSSNGKVQERFKVRTVLRIGDLERETDFTLVNRKRMLCRALLGRNALGHDFLVDSQATYLFGPRRKKKKEKKSWVLKAEDGTGEQMEH